jgi:hypothetical protein
MTAEVAIINPHAVALAADSAVTVGRERVWKYANKLFSAGPQNDIGIMIYNSGDFLGVPWEVIVKEYRRRRGTKTFKRTSEFADDFISFLRSDALANEGHEQLSVAIIVMDILSTIKSDMNYHNRAEFYAQLPKILEQHKQHLVDTKELPVSLTFEEFEKHHAKTTKKLAPSVFKHKPKRDSLPALYEMFLNT